VSLLYVAGCPHAESYARHLQGLCAQAGVREPVRLVRVEDLEQARAHRFPGSPTVQVEGRDVDPSTAGDPASGPAFAVACRLYQSADGVRPTPPDAWVLAALGAAAREPGAGPADPGPATGGPATSAKAAGAPQVWW